MRTIVGVLLAVLLMTSPTSLVGRASGADDPLDASLRHDASFAAGRLDAAAKALSHTRYPSSTKSDGSWDATGASGWTSGFFSGVMWQMYELTGDPIWLTRATDWQAGLEGRKNDTSTHDVGFVIGSSFGNGYRLTGTDAYRQVVLAAAGSLATRFNAKVGSIRSSGSGSGDITVIIDNMMNLEILFWASKHGGSASWYDMAVSHALRTMTDHVRADGSTYQVVKYDPNTGAVKSKSTNQGASTDSTWSRGQAWAIHGFTMSYRETGDPRFLDTARRTAAYFVGHLPPDKVPYWDFQAPGIPNEPRDSSAASIAAAGLLELGQLEVDPARATADFTAAREILASLSTSAYLSEGTGSQAVLLHGTQNKRKSNFDTGLIFGDYYFLEALLRSPAVRGRVTDRATGQAIVGATVTADAGSTRSRIDGDYTLASVGAGPRTITASAPGYVVATQNVVVPAMGGATADIVLDAGGSGAPVADFDADATSGVASVQVQFTDRSINGPVQWAWTFGDGGTSTVQSPSHFYAAPGTYDVSLVATNPSGSDSKTKTGYITVSGGGGGGASTITLTPDADAQIKVGSSSPVTDTTHLRTREENPVASSTYRGYLRFNVQGMTAPATGVTLRLYVTTPSSNLQSVFATSGDQGWPEGLANSTNVPTIGSVVSLAPVAASPAGAYKDIPLDPSSIAGNGPVTFALKSSATTSGYFASKELTSPLSPPQLVITQAVGAGPTADFVASNPTSGGVPLSVTFDSSASTGTGLSYQWDFGDGSAGLDRSAADPIHQYLSAGTFSVSLTVTDVDNLRATKTRSNLVVLDTSPVAQFSVDRTSGTSPLTVVFDGSGSTGTNLVDHWDFGDPGSGSTNNASSAQKPSHSFSAGGVYQVTLTVSNAAGSNTSSPTTITVTQASNVTITVPVAFDAHVNSNKPDTNYGGLTPIRTREDPTIPGNTYRPYFQFNVPSFGGTVSSVKLRLYVTTASSGMTQRVYLVGNGWTESGNGSITWNNAPPIGSTAIGAATAGSANTYVDIALNTPIVPNTSYSFALKSSGTSSVYFNSDDATTNKPELVIATGP